MIYMEGNPTLEQYSKRMEPQPINWTLVKFPKKRNGPRPNLTDTMEEKVTEDLNKHLEGKYRGGDCPKTRAQQPMPEDQRQ